MTAIHTVVIPIKQVFKRCQKGDYRNDPKFLDRYAWENSVDLDETAPRGGAVWSGSTLFAIPSVSFGLITLW